MTATEQARSRRLTAALEEACGNGAPPELVDRIVNQLTAEPIPPRKGPVTTLFATAAALLGVVAVFGVAGLGDSQATAINAAPNTAPSIGNQDPDPARAKLTTADVLESVLTINPPPPPGPAVARLLAVCADSLLAIVVDATMDANSRVDLAALGRREAVDRIAREIGASVAEFDGVLFVSQRGAPPRPLTRSRISVTETTVTMQQLAKLVHARAGINLVVAADVTGQLDITVKDVPWRALLAAATSRLRHEVVGHGSALTIRRAGKRERRHPAMQRSDGSAVEEALASWASAAQLNLIIDPKLGGRVATFAFEPRSQGMLTALAAGARADIETIADNLFRVVPTLDGDSTMTQTAESIAIRELIAASGELGARVDANQVDDTPVTVFAAGARSLDLVRAAIDANRQSLARRESRYIVE